MIEVVSRGRVATLSLNRPEARNALSIELCDAIVDELATLEASDARVLLLRGEGPVFCSGADLAAVGGTGGPSFLPAFERMLEAVARFRLPTVARIHGAALGGGLQLATVCDLRVCSQSSKLGIPASRLGILVNFENVQRLVLLAGVATAKEVLMTGRSFLGPEAEARGLVNRCVPDAELDAATDELVEELAERAPLSVQGTKRAIQAVLDHLGAARTAAPAPVAAIDDLVAAAYASEDLAEGIRAMGEKRRPGFKGR